MIASVRAATTIAGNELRRHAQDGMSVFWLVALPLVVVLVIGLVIGDALTGTFVPATPITLVVEGAPGATRTGFTTAAASDEAAPYVTLEPLGESRTGDDAVRSGAVDAAIVIPDGFPLEPVRVIAPPDGLAGEIAMGLARAIWAGVASSAVPRLGWTEAIVDRTEVSATPAGESPPRTGRDRRPWLGARGFEYYSVGMTIYFAMFAALAAMTTYGRDRESGVYHRARAFGVGAWTYLAGRVLGAFMLAVAVLSLLALGTRLLYGVSWGPLLPWAALTLAGAAAIALITLVPVAIAPGAKGIEAVGNMAIVALALLGGTFTPLAILLSALPPWLVAATAWLPNRALLDGYFIVMRGGGLGDVVPEIIAIALTGAGVGIVSVAALALRGRGRT